STPDLYTLSLHDALPIYRTTASREKILDVRQHRGVFAQLSSEQSRNRLTRDVVRRGPQSTGHENQVGVRQRFTNGPFDVARGIRSEEHTSELQSLTNLVC